MIDPEYHLNDEGYDDDGDCWKCGGEGFVHDCIDGFCEHADEGCDLCAKRCEICNPPPTPPSAGGHDV